MSACSSAGGLPRKPRLPFGDELLGVGVGQRRDAELGLADQLREDASGPERHERAEDRVLDDAGEELGAAREHRLDQDWRADALSGLANLVLSRETERNPAGFGLVRAGLRALDNCGKTELGGSCHCFLL